MEEIKVGEYVRMINGLIAKIITTDKDNHYILDRYYAGGRHLTEIEVKNDIVKHSKNIIDLIEEGDFVNGKYVYSIGTAIGNLPIINHTDGTFTPSNLIKTIVTKEQFAQMEYKIKG